MLQNLNIKFQELKRKGNQLESFKPTPAHWAIFANKVVEKKLFDGFLELAYQQSFWQFVNCLAMEDVTATSQAAKENAVLSLIYINLARMVLGSMLGPVFTADGIIPKTFMDKLSKVKTEEEMDRLVEVDFRKLLKLPNDHPNVKLPTFTRGFDATTIFSEFLVKYVSRFYF